MAEQQQPIGPEGTAGGEKSSTKGGKTFLVTVIAVCVAALGAGAAAAYFFFPEVQAMTRGGDSPTQVVAEPVEYGEFMEMEGLVVNPAGSSGRRALMVNVGMEGKDEKVLEAVKSKQVVIKDKILNKLGKLTVEQLSDITIRDSIKTDLLREINGVLEDRGLSRIYFTAYILQ